MVNIMPCISIATPFEFTETTPLSLATAAQQAELYALT